MNRTPYRRLVQYYETDRMGIVHHSNYIRWFEEARTDFLRNNGIVYSDLEQSGVMIPVVNVSGSTFPTKSGMRPASSSPPGRASTASWTRSAGSPST